MKRTEALRPLLNDPGIELIDRLDRLQAELVRLRSGLNPPLSDEERKTVIQAERLLLVGRSYLVAEQREQLEHWLHPLLEKIATSVQRLSRAAMDLALFIDTVESVEPLGGSFFADSLEELRRAYDEAVDELKQHQREYENRANAQLLFEFADDKNDKSDTGAAKAEEETGSLTESQQYFLDLARALALIHSQLRLRLRTGIADNVKQYLNQERGASRGRKRIQGRVAAIQTARDLELPRSRLAAWIMILEGVHADSRSLENTLAKMEKEIQDVPPDFNMSARLKVKPERLDLLNAFAKRGSSFRQLIKLAWPMDLEWDWPQTLDAFFEVLTTLERESITSTTAAAPY